MHKQALHGLFQEILQQQGRGMEEITCPEENYSENIDLKGSVFEQLPKTAQ